MKLLESTGKKKKKVDKDKNVKKIRNHWSGILYHCNILNNNYQCDSRVLYTFVQNKSFGQLLDISPKNLLF